jgi:hypothetical protein
MHLATGFGGPLKDIDLPALQGKFYRRGQAADTGADHCNPARSHLRQAAVQRAPWHGRSVRPVTARRSVIDRRHSFEKQSLTVA